MAEERIYTIPLRIAFLKAPIYKRTKRAINKIKIFISRHMKVEDVRIGTHLNEFLWKNGNQNPPSKVKVKTRKVENYAQVELESFPFYEKKEKEEEKKKVEAKEAKQEKIVGDQIKEEEKLVNEGKAKEIEKREVKHGTGPEKKEELRSKQMQEKVESTHKISKSQKGIIKHPKAKK